MCLEVREQGGERHVIRLKRGVMGSHGRVLGEEHDQVFFK